MDLASPWRIVWDSDGKSGRATHIGGLEILFSRTGWAMVTERPPSISEVEATVLLAELQRLLTDEDSISKRLN